MTTAIKFEGDNYIVLNGAPDSPQIELFPDGSGVTDYGDRAEVIVGPGVQEAPEDVNRTSWAVTGSRLGFPPEVKGVAFRAADQSWAIGRYTYDTWNAFHEAFPNL